MNKMKIALIALLIAAIGLVMPAQTLLAAPLPQEQGEGHSISCEGGVCSIAIDLAQTPGSIPAVALWAAPGLLRVAQENLDFVPDDLTLEVNDHLVLALPVGNIVMLDADLQVELNDEQQVDRFYGTATAPFPTLDLINGAQLVLPGRAHVGFDSGENLAYLGAPLDPDRNYLALHFGGGVDRGVESSFRFTGAEGENSLTLIIDPTDLFVYLVGNLMLVDVSELLLADQIAGGALLPMVPNFFPVPERVGGRVALLVTDNLDDFKLEIGTGYAVDSGSLGRRFGLDIKPIAFEGAMALNRSGLTMSGFASSSLQPSLLFDGAGTAEFHIPFNGDAADAYVEMDTNLAVPIVGLARDGSVNMSLEEFAQRIDAIEGPERMAQLRGRMADATARMGESLDPRGIHLTDLFADISDRAATASATVGNAVTDVVSETVPNAVSGVSETVTGAVSGMGDTMSAAVTDVFSDTKIGESVMAAPAISGTMAAIPSAVTGTVSSSVDWAAQLAGGVYDAGRTRADTALCHWLGRCGNDAVAQSEP